MNDNLPEKATKVCAAVCRAFAALKGPPPGELVTEMCYEVERDFRGKHWTEVSHEMLLEEHGEATLQSLTPKAFRFYLPAFMLAVLESEGVNKLADDLVYALLPPYTGETDEDADFLRLGADRMAEDFADVAGDRVDELHRLAEESCEDSAMSRKTEEQETVADFIAKVEEFAPEQKKAIWLFLEYMEQRKAVTLLMDGMAWENLKRFWRDGLLPFAEESDSE